MNEQQRSVILAALANATERAKNDPEFARDWLARLGPPEEEDERGPNIGERFNYIVACEWERNSPHLCVYTYHDEVQYGTRRDAEDFLEYVREQSPEKPWRVIVIDPARGLA